jgi:hypothetical protein
MPNMSNINNFGSKVHELKQEADNKAPGQKISAAAHEKNELRKTEHSAETLQKQINATILQSDLNVSINSGDQSLSLLYKTAIEGINDLLGENAIQDASESGLDVSPEATAERIVSMSTAFFPSYLDQHPEMTEQEAAEEFTQLIGQGIDNGFSEAREILAGLKVLEGDVAANIDTTYTLTQEGLQTFLESYTKPLEADTNNSEA